MYSRRSASVGALPREKKHYVSRNESGSGISLDVRCACQYFQSDSLMPERAQPSVDSRPSSKLGLHAEIIDHSELLAWPEQTMHDFRPMNYMDAQRPTATTMEAERLSMHSSGVITAPPPPVDLSFLERYPELEETARKRKLIVRSISNASDDVMRESSVGGAAGMRFRQTSESGMDFDTLSMRSGTSVRRISRSPSKADLFIADIILPSSTQQHTPYDNYRQPRSASATRRSSNADTTHFGPAAGYIAPIGRSRQPTPAYLSSSPTRVPEINLISPTPAVTGADVPPEFPQAAAQRATPDYRNVRPKPSVDYMRPSESNEFLFRTVDGVMPQNRPIDMSRYGKDTLVAKPTPTPTTQAQDTSLSTRNLSPTREALGVSTQSAFRVPSREATPNRNLSPTREALAVSSQSAFRVPSREATPNRNLSPTREALALSSQSAFRVPSREGSPFEIQLSRSREASPMPASVKSLEDTVAELEEFVTEHNLVEIVDTIQASTKEPPRPTFEQHPASAEALQLGSNTEINIVTTVPIVDIDELVQQEVEKAAQQQQHPRPPPRHLSPPAKRPHSPTPMSTLQLPIAGSMPKMDTTTTSTAEQRPKRAASPSFLQVSPARTKHLPEPQLVEMHTVTISGPLQEASPEAKSTYAARFKSMFTSKGNGSSPRRQRSPSPSPVRQKSPSASPMREKSPTPMREKSPTPNKSPSPNRATKLTAMFSKIKPTQIEVVNSSNSVKPKKPEAEPLSVKVTETFSLKVDEMDQYCTQPPKPPQLPPTAQSAYSDDFLANSERVSVDIADAFAPVVIGSSNRQSFLAGNRTMYSSDIDVRPKRLSTDFQYSSKEMSIGSSTPISHSKPALFSAPINIPTHPHAVTAQHHLGHSMLEHKPTFISERTQSHDRAQRVSGSSDDLFKSRMTKTVSFNFDERQSRLSEFKSRSPSSQQAVEKTEFLDRTYFSRDHDYEPIGEPAGNEAGLKREASPMPISQAERTQSTELNILSAEIKEAADLQKELEDRYFTQTAAAQQEADDAAAATERSLAEAEDMESPEDEAPKAEKRGFMATAQDHTRRMQTGIKNQATKIKTRLRPVPKKPVSGSPKSKKKERFKAPQFSKIKMPAIKKPDMSKIKDFKRPEFTKFSKPDMTKFKLPERLTTLKLKRSHSLKHEDINDNELSTQSPDSQPATDNQPQKKTFEFNFGTYPRAFRKKKKPVEPESPFGTEGTSIQPSNTTQPSFESSSSPQGDRGPGPVRSRWADKFSDVSYNDSEGSRYRRYGSEQESFDKESSLERRMKDDLEESASEINESMGILGGRVGETKQFAEFDEENRAIHEISNLRSGEFKRRPMVHQDSDLRSEDSKDAEGWTDKDIQRNKLLRKAEMEAEASFLKYHTEDGQALDNRSMASSTGRKVVMEEIDDDEFFLRKRGISEDNIELRQYISSAIREGYDTPLNALQNVGQTTEPPMEFGDYDVPPPKPRRLHKGYRPQDDSQEYDLQRSDYGDDFSVSQNGSDFFMVPKKPLRKDRSRSKYSMDSEIPMADERTSREQYFDNDEDYLRPPNYDANDLGMNDLSFSSKQQQEDQDVGDVGYPQPPRRQKRRMREGSQEKDSLINGLSGKSVSSSFLQQPKDVIVYRTEHEYHIPIATPETYTDDASTSTHKSRSASRYDEDDRTSSHGAQSFHMNDDAKENIDYNGNSRDDQSKFIIDMMENDGYAIVRKEHMPKPTPPARRKRFARSPGERFATLPNMRTKRGTPPPERPPPPRSYVPSVEQSTPPVRQSSHSLDAPYNIDDDYEEPETLDRPESPRNLQSGEIINRMKYRPLPAPPRPPREKRQRSDLKSSLQTAGTTDEESAIEYADSEDTEQRGTASELEEVEAATQTDPLPDNYEVAELEITDSMRIIEPRRRAKTIEELLQEELAEKNVESSQAQDEDEQLTRGLQRFREANQRSLSERSRASSSQADRSKSLSRPQTPSAVVVESRVSTPSPYTREVAVLEASLLVKPLDDLDLEEAELRREGLLSDSSQQSKSDIEKEYKEYEEKYKQDERKLFVDDLSNAPSSTELNVTDYEQRLRSFDERDMSQSEQEQEQEEGEEKTAAEATLSDLEAEIEARYRKLYSRDLELDSKQFSQEEEDESKLLKSDYESEDDYRAQQQTETATEEYTVEQADETVEAKVKEIEKEAEVEVEQPFEKVVTKDTVDAAFTPSNLTTKQETEQEIREASPAVEEQPLPPPRRKSTTNIEQPAVPAPAPTPAEPTSTTMTVAEVAPVAAPTTTTVVQMPSSVSDLAVERLHVHALQAGQIMVSQMHGAHISSDQLECNTANLVVNNIQLPPGFIEDIVERVHRSTDSRPTTLLTVETQTSQTASSEDLPKEGSPIPPKKPARQKQLESQQADTAEIPPSLQHQQQQQSQHKNPDEQTQTDPIDPMLSNLPPLYPTAEYLQSLAPLAFYNMHRATAPSDSGERLAGVERSESMQRRRRPYRRHSSSSGGEEPEDLANANEKPHTHRRRTRSSTQPPEAQPPTIRQAATQFLSACSLSLVNIINQLTDYVRSDDKKVLGRTRQVPTLVALFVVITFVLLLFLLSGKNVHTHHWDFFNLPGNEGRK